MEAGFDAPAGTIELQPTGGVESFGWEAGQEAHLLGLATLDFAAQPGRLANQWKADLLCAERAALEKAGFLAALIALAAAGESGALGADFPRTAAGGVNGCCGLREKRRRVAPPPSVRCCGALWVGCL